VVGMDFSNLEKSIGYKFNDTTYVERALTHSSANQNSDKLDYERLEFLGDRVVNLIVADLLFLTFSDEREGELAKRHTALVRTEMLAKISKELSLGDFVILSSAERRAGGAENDNILADLTEAVTAAIYLDGGYRAAQDFIKNILGDRLIDMKEPPRDAKTALQEWTQAQGYGLPTYDLVEQSGPDHAPDFTVCLIVQDHHPINATSNSKKRAEKDAARLFLVQKGLL
jgi:ribonuclease-3